MKLLEKQFEFSKNVSLLIDFIFSQGLKCTLGEVYRPNETAKLYAKEGRGIANSLHCQRLAIDINLFTHDGLYLTKSNDYKEVGAYWELLHEENKWGGNFGDGNHFQMNMKD